jgi:hypothetical protein
LILYSVAGNPCQLFVEVILEIFPEILQGVSGTANLAVQAYRTSTPVQFKGMSAVLAGILLIMLVAVA